MRHGLVPIALICLGACASTSAPLPPLQTLMPDIHSEAIQRQLAGERDAALREAARSEETVTRRFYVGDEHHHGLYLLPIDRLDDFTTPDFLDYAVRQQFVREFHQDNLRARVGRRLLCECSGVEWRFHSTRRFLVHRANLTWVD